MIPNDPKIRLGNGNLVPILDISSKQIYGIFLRKKQISPTAKRKLTDKYPDINVEWDKVYSLPFRSTLESKTREFQYKILNCIVFTNEDNGIYIETLKEWDIKDNFTLINHLLLLGKYYIYSKKCQNSLSTVHGFIARIKLIYRIELQIARGKNKLSQHFIKWRKLVEVLTQEEVVVEGI